MQGNESYVLGMGCFVLLQKDPFLGSFLKLGDPNIDPQIL